MVYQADHELEAAQRGERPFTGITSWLEREELIRELFTELELNDAKLDELLMRIGNYGELKNRMMYHGEINHDIIMAAIPLGTSDFQLIHYLCLYMANVPNRNEIFEALSILEILMDLEANLLEYANDVAMGNYNVYRMFVKLYGKEAPKHMEAQLAQYDKLLEEKIEALPQEEQALFSDVFSKIYSKYPKDEWSVIPEPILE